MFSSATVAIIVLEFSKYLLTYITDIMTLYPDQHIKNANFFAIIIPTNTKLLKGPSSRLIFLNVGQSKDKEFNSHGGDL